MSALDADRLRGHAAGPTSDEAGITISFGDLRAFFDRIDQAEDRNDSLRDELGHAIRERDEWEANAETTQRAAQTLGKVIEDQCRDIAHITRSEHLVDKDGDADWGTIWELGYSMADERDTARKQVQAVRAVTENHPDPRCDIHPDDSAISCGWKHAYTDVLTALDQED